MCNKRNCVEISRANQSGRLAKVDECIAEEINRINRKGGSTLASCCGHGKYKKTIVVLHKDGWSRMEKFTKLVIPRRRRFYKKDKEGYYYIPETIK